MYDVANKHKTKIAKATLKMSDAGARIMGGMTKDEAREHLLMIGWTASRIERLED
jgi:hypothetical protein